MFVRFRHTPRRLQASIVETRRVDGKVKHEHVAMLGSVETPPTVADRIAFWQRVNDRLAKLANRLDPAMQGKIRGELHTRVPMVTPDEQRALQLENAEADERFWSSLHDMHAETVEDHKGLAASVESSIAKGKASAADAAANAAAAKERAERIRNGEDVAGGLGKPMTSEDAEAIMRKAGMTKQDIEHCRRVNLLHELGGEEAFERYLSELWPKFERAERAAKKALVRRMLKDLQRS